MIADAHYHLDPRLESVEQLLAQMQVHAIGRVALIAAPCDPLQVGRAGAAFVRFMRRALEGGAPRLGRILYRSTVRRSGRVSFLSRSAAVYPEPDNDAVERAFSAHPEQFVGWLFLNPRAKSPVEEAERRFRNPGWIGVKAHPFWHRYPVAALDDVAALCQERDKPMLVHLGAGAGRGDFRRLPKRFPRLKLVYAHAGIPWYGTLWDDAIRREEPAEVREEERIDPARLEPFLRRTLPEATGPVSVLQFPKGHSNLTYLLRVGERELVLRRPPFGVKVKSAHDMKREYDILSALKGVYGRAPKPIAFCDDESLIGAKFYLMERVRGVIVRAEKPHDGIAFTPELWRKTS